MARTLLVLLVLLMSKPLMAETWTITSLEWAPYSGKALPGQGTAISELRRVLATADIRLEVEFYPWKRARKYASQPGYVGYFPAWPDEVEDNFTASAPIQNSTIGVLYPASQPLQWTSLPGLFEKHNVGLIKSYVYPEPIESAAKTFPDNVRWAPHEKSLVRMLAEGRMDAAISDPAVMIYEATHNGVPHIQLKVQTLGEVPLVVSFANNEANQDRIELLNRLLEGQP
ncbi:transporter substrate-binding domain-containing protein [Marinobacteraceae bacterium S3BR75-40.1]